MKNRAITLAASSLCALTIVTTGATTAQAVALDAQVPFAAYRDGRGLVVKEGDGRGTSVADGTVEVHHEHGAIRFAFRPANAGVLHTDAFERIDGRRAAPVLGQAVETDLDLRGVYRAEVRDAAGASVGWLRVSVSPFDVPPRVYEGRVPATLSPRMIRTALAHLDAEIDTIEARATDVDLGN
jgi:hypothetical protein